MENTMNYSDQSDGSLESPVVTYNNNNNNNLFSCSFYKNLVAISKEIMTRTKVSVSQYLTVPHGSHCSLRLTLVHL